MAGSTLHEAIRDANLSQQREGAAKISSKYLELASAKEFKKYERQCAIRYLGLVREKIDSALKDANAFYRGNWDGFSGQERVFYHDREQTLWSLLSEWKRHTDSVGSFCMENSRERIFGLPFDETMNALGLGQSLGMAIAYSKLLAPDSRLVAKDGSPCAIVVETDGAAPTKIGSFEVYETTQRKRDADGAGIAGTPLPLVGVDFEDDLQGGIFRYTSMRIHATIAGYRIPELTEEKMGELFKTGGHDFKRFVENASYKLVYGHGFDRKRIECAVRDAGAYCAILRPITADEWNASPGFRELAIDIKVRLGVAKGSNAYAKFTIPEMAPHLIVCGKDGVEREEAVNSRSLK